MTFPSSGLSAQGEVSTSSSDRSCRSGYFAVSALACSAVIPRWASARPKKLKSLQSMDDPVVLEALGYAELFRGRKDEALQLLNAAVDSEQEDAEYADAERVASSSTCSTWYSAWGWRQDRRSLRSGAHRRSAT